MSNNSTPYEVLAGPATLWVAPVGTAFPDVDTTPSGSWTKVGTSGDLNYDEGGVTVEHAQSVSTWKGLGSTGPRKAFRSSEDLMVSLTLVDLSPAQYAMAMEYQTPASVAAGSGTPGTKTIGLTRGLTVNQRALLVRGASPAADNMAAQYEIEVAIQEGTPSVVFVKDKPAGLALKFRALEDPNASSEAERFGRLVVQDADALT